MTRSKAIALGACFVTGAAFAADPQDLVPAFVPDTVAYNAARLASVEAALTPESPVVVEPEAKRAEPRRRDRPIARIPDRRARTVSPADAAFAALLVDEQLTRHALERFIDEWPGHTAARLALARLYVVGGDAVGVLDVLEPVFTLAKPPWRAWFYRGTAHLLTGALAEAKEHLERALEDGSRESAVWVQLAVVEQRLDNHAGALQLLEIAASIEPDDAQVHLNRAYSHERLGHLESAKDAYRRYLTSQFGSHIRKRHGFVMRRLAVLLDATSGLDA
mgnify:CR=1 FL=1